MTSRLSADKQNIDLKEQLIKEYELEIEKTKKRLSDKETTLEKKYEDFRVLLRLSYEDQDFSLLEILFNSESLTDFLVNSERTAILLEYQSTMLNDLKLEADDLNNLKLKLENMLAEQIKLKEDLHKVKATRESTELCA